MNHSSTTAQNMTNIAQNTLFCLLVYRWFCDVSYLLPGICVVGCVEVLPRAWIVSRWLGEMTDAYEIKGGPSCSVMPLWCFLYFCYWHFISFWNEIGILCWKWALMVTNLLVPLNHKRWDYCVFISTVKLFLSGTVFINAHFFIEIFKLA